MDSYPRMQSHIFVSGLTLTFRFLLEYLTNMHMFKFKFAITLHTLPPNWPSKTTKEIQESMTSALESHQVSPPS